MSCYVYNQHVLTSEEALFVISIYTGCPNSTKSHYSYRSSAVQLGIENSFVQMCPVLGRISSILLSCYQLIVVSNSHKCKHNDELMHFFRCDTRSHLKYRSVCELSIADTCAQIKRLLTFHADTKLRTCI